MIPKIINIKPLTIPKASLFFGCSTTCITPSKLNKTKNRSLKNTPDAKLTPALNPLLILVWTKANSAGPKPNKVARVIPNNKPSRIANPINILLV